MTDKIKVLPTLPETKTSNVEKQNIKVFKSSADLKNLKKCSSTVKNLEKFTLEPLSSHLIKVDFGKTFNEHFSFSYELFVNDDEISLEHVTKTYTLPTSSVDILIRNKLNQKREVQLIYKVETF